MWYLPWVKVQEHQAPQSSLAAHGTFQSLVPGQHLTRTTAASPISIPSALSPSWRVLAVFLTVDYIQLLEPENMLQERPLWPCLISRSFSVGLYVCKLQGVADAFKISHSVRGAELWLQNVMFCVGWAERRRLQILKSHRLKHLHLKVNYDMQPLCSLVLVSVACP